MEQIPITTIQRHMATFTAAAKQHSIPVTEVVTCEMIVANRGGAGALLNAHDCRFLSDVAISRDLRNNGMTRLNDNIGDGTFTLCLTTTS